ncbi:hypothetical protein [Aequorivita capsosiphonis]|uniref:hypothetical protein n=1 Tax=Aequorivita capsosiphonis TaxID=487317 RepID=UPI00042305EC|nr:hypothetical protein [Aequorivita capsosiphonis]
MHNRLITESFEKALKQEEERGNINPSKSRLATVLSYYIEENQDFQFGERRLRDYYNEALAATQVEIKQPAVLNGLSSFLGYSDYTDFVIRIKGDKKDLIQNGSDDTITYNLRITDFVKHHKVSLAIAIVSAMVILFLMVSKQQRWMKWDGTNYIEASFDADKLSKGELKAYKEDRIANFTRLNPQCETQFFNADGSVRVWYSKNKNGSLDFFSSYGLHPITGKTLKPVTRYIIDKYVCER